MTALIMVSALPSKADMCNAKASVRLGAKAGTASLARSERIAVPAMKLEQELDKPSSVVIIARLEGDFSL